MGLIGFWVFGPQMLIGLAAAESVNKKAACTANGFVGCCAYLGAAFSGYPLGYLMEEYNSWDTFFVYIIGCSVMVVITILPIFFINKQN